MYSLIKDEEMAAGSVAWPVYADVHRGGRVGREFLEPIVTVVWGLCSVFIVVVMVSATSPLITLFVAPLSIVCKSVAEISMASS